VSVSTISKIENLQQKPSFETALRVARALKVNCYFDSTMRHAFVSKSTRRFCRSGRSRRGGEDFVSFCVAI
jgi:hypothetical protein